MKFKTKPYNHQLEVYNRFKDEPYFALFMQMGTGKSKVAIDISSYKYEKGEINAVLIIAPNNVHSQWITEQFPTHCSVPYKSFLWNSSKKNTLKYANMSRMFLVPPSDKLKVFAVNVEAFQSEGVIPYITDYVKNNEVFIIIDEATRIKTPSAKRSKTIHRLEKYGKRCILTGTPVTKSPFGLWSMFEFLKHNFFGINFFIFQARHGVMIQGINQRTGGRYKTLIDEKMWKITLYHIDKMHKERNSDKLMPDDYLTISSMLGISEKNVRFIEKQRDFVKYKRLDELKEKIDPITFYANKKDCLDLPDKIYQTVLVDMPKEHRKIYDTLRKKLLVEYAGKELTVLNKVALMTRLMQICGGFFPYIEEDENMINGVSIVTTRKKAEPIGSKNAKLERIKEELDEADLPVIIWGRFTAELESIYKELKKDYKCALYYGKTTQIEREMIIDDFKNGDYDIFIGNPAVAGFGLNLQIATTQFYYSNSFNVEERLQAEDRSHRIGVKRSCVYKDFVYKGTVDEKITYAIKVGRDLNEMFSSSNILELLQEGK